MSTIRMFRINAFDPVTRKMEFYYKIADGQEHVLCNLMIADGGVYYYKKKSRIMSNNENENTRETWDAFLSMEELKEFFEALIKSRLEKEDVSITARRGKITVEKRSS